MSADRHGAHEGEESSAQPGFPVIVLPLAHVRGLLARPAHGLTDRTMIELRSDLRSWSRFASERGRPECFPIAPTDHAAWLTWQHEAGLQPATILRRATSMVTIHEIASQPSPACVRAAALLRALAPSTSRVSSKRALTLAMVSRALAVITLSSAASCALIVGAHAGLSRGEIASLTWGAVKLGSTTAKIDLIGRVVTLHADQSPVCPVSALRCASASTGSTAPGDKVFVCSAHTVGRAVKRAARAAGESEAGFSVGSIRLGYIEAQARGSR